MLYIIIKMTTYDILYKEIKNLKIYEIEDYINNYDKESNIFSLETILYIIYDIHNYEYQPINTCEVVIRNYQNKFRKELIKRYTSCIITNKDIEICEACHIIPFCDSNYKQKYDIDNGILLCSELHILFDLYMWSINDKGIVVFSDTLKSKSGFSEYHKYDGYDINDLLNDETKKNLSIHYSNFLKKLKI